MNLLLKVTGFYLVVLVVALAGSLIGILTFLRRIANRLGEVRTALAPAPDLTEPLGGHLEAIHAVVTEVADDMALAKGQLGLVDEGLGALAKSLTSVRATG